jgi:hypothetical protein
LYIQNLLRVAEYAPQLLDRILTVIVERLIHLDVCTMSPLHIYTCTYIDERLIGTPVWSTGGNCGG